MVGAGLTGRMTPVGGIVVTVALFAVAVTAVFGADDVCFLECRTGRRDGQYSVREGGEIERERERERSTNNIGKEKMKGNLRWI